MMLRWLVDEIGPDMACASASTSFSFDPSMMELFGPLVCGGKIELVQEALALVPEGRRPTWTFTTPSIAAELLRAGRVPTSVRVLTLGGEVVTPALARGLLALPHLRRLVNVYGPTEAAVVTTRYEVTAPVGAVVPMGTAVPGTEVLVVDAHLCPVAPGEVGELLLLGPQVALGYANNPAATAKSFIEVAGADGSLVPTYRTGDLVREVAGQLEFCGRADRQVKLRGFRVDLAGIEASLLGLASVARAKVLVSGAGSDAALVACVVPSAGSFDEKAAKEHLKAELPRYMVPGRFLTCDAFPLTPNGKLDEAALLARFGQRPAMSRPAGSRSLSGTEAAIAHLIGEVLDTASPTFGSADFLDDLGGTSLGLVQLLAMMEESFGCKLPVRSAFGDTTVSGLANLVDDGESQASPAGPAPSRLGGGTLFFVNPYGGSAVRFRRLAQHLGKGTRAVGLHVQADNGQRSVAGMAAEAIVQMKAAQPEGPYLLGGHSAGGVVALEMARLLRSGGQTADVLLLDTTAQMSWLDAAWATLVLNWPTFKHAPMPERFRLVRRAMGRTPGGFGDGLAGTVDERARLTNAAVRQYHPTPYDGDVTLLWTDHGRRMARGRKDLGWGQLVSGRLDSRWVPGDHINMFDSPNVDALAKEVRRFVDDTTAMAGLTSWLETSAAAAAGAGQP